MLERVLGCDVSKDYIILHDGSQAYKLSLENFKSIQRLVNNSIVVMEQTGAYGLRWEQRSILQMARTLRTSSFTKR